MAYDPNQPRDEKGRWSSGGLSLENVTVGDVVGAVAHVALSTGGMYGLGMLAGQYKRAKAVVNVLQSRGMTPVTSTAFKVVNGIETSLKTGKWSTAAKAPKGGPKPSSGRKGLPASTNKKKLLPGG